jgi:hypothetical protein
MLLLFLGLLPAILVLIFLLLSVFLTDVNYLSSGENYSIILQWFFIMVPFSLILSPTVVFFFNFALESFLLVKKSFD